MEQPVFKEVFLPKLLELAAEGYPNPKDFKTYEEMLPKYTFALGGTDAIRRIKEWLEEQSLVAETLKEKYENRAKYQI
jgi:hypothetical protein